MKEVNYEIITSQEEGQRLDNYLLRILKGVPKSHIYRIIRSGEVRINKKRAKPNTRLLTGDSIRIPPVRVSEHTDSITVSHHLEKKLEQSILYEDNGLLVVNKPAGIAVHGGSGISLGIIEAFRKIRTDLPYLELVHRLDKETSGCLLLAKKRSMLRAIQALLTERKVNKTYWMILTGHWDHRNTLTVDVPLLKNTLQSGERMVEINEQGKSATTQFKLLENYSNACWIEGKPHTGRTHQLRVHSAHLGHPIIGDEKYNRLVKPQELTLSTRLYLHAHKIRFNLDGKVYEFEAELDAPFTQALQVLRSQEE